MKKILASTIIVSSIITFLLLKRKHKEELTWSNWCDTLEREIIEDIYGV